jgi:hypothetical protein
MLVLVFLVESFSFHPGLVFSYSPAPYILGFGFTSISFVCLLQNGVLKFNFIASIVALILTILFYVIKNMIEQKEIKKAEKRYNRTHNFSIDNINKEKFKELINDCKSNNIEFNKRPCNCRCQFGDVQPIDNVDTSWECVDFDGNKTTNLDECCTLFDCSNSNCSVFNTLVDYKTGNLWCKQDTIEDGCDRLCLLTKLTKEQIEELSK